MVFSWHFNHPNQWKAQIKSQKIRRISVFWLGREMRLQSSEAAHIFVVAVPDCKNRSSGEEGNHETIFELMAYS